MHIIHRADICWKFQLFWKCAFSRNDSLKENFLLLPKQMDRMKLRKLLFNPLKIVILLKVFTTVP